MDDETALSITYDKYTEITLGSTDYTLIATPGAEYIVKNKSGYPIYVAMNDDRNTLTGDTPQTLLGGLTYELLTDKNKYVWARASRGDTKIAIRPNGTVDPTQDIVALGTALNNYIVKTDNHITNDGNPHNVTKAQVGLGNIPNVIDSNVNSNSAEILATTKLTHTLKESIDNHVANINNPHRVTKDQVGLDSVDNYPTAKATVLADCLETVTDKFVTPAVAYRVARLATAVAYSVKPQMVVSAYTGTRDANWLLGECDAPCNSLFIYDDSHVQIRPGLSVSYGIDHKSRISETLEEPSTVAVPTDIPNSYYIYVDIGIEGYITGAGSTVLPPVYDTARNGGAGDFFNIATCIMYDAEDHPIRRVYIGRAIVEGRSIVQVIPVPIGDIYITPLGHDLVLSARYLLDNPFLTGRVTVTPEVAFRDAFGPTCWNDQIGVVGAPHPLYANTLLVVQCGQMGFLASGRESGTPFGSAFTTVTTTLRTRVVIQRQW